MTPSKSHLTLTVQEVVASALAARRLFFVPAADSHKNTIILDAHLCGML